MFVPKRTADAVSLFASQSRLAELLGVTPPAVAQWTAAGRLPTKRALQVRDLLKDQPGFDAAAYTRLIEAEALAGRA